MAARIAAPAGFAAGLAAPLVGAWLLGPVAWRPAVESIVSAGAAFVLLRWGGARWTSPRVALAFAVVALLWTRVVP
jgi:hypothetical protein